MNTFKSSKMIELEKLLEENLNNINVCERQKDKDFFLSEYNRIFKLYQEESLHFAEWLALRAI